MAFNNGQLKNLVESLEQSKSHLVKRHKSEPGYEKLIDLFDHKINFLRENKKLRIKLVSTSADLVLGLKEKSEADVKLRSLYNFEAISPFKNISQIVNNCSAIFAIFRFNQTITQHHRKLIDIAYKKDIIFFILVVRNKSNNHTLSFEEYIKSQDSLEGSHFLLPVNDFFDLDNEQDLEHYQNNLVKRITMLQDKLVQNSYISILRDIECFFHNQNRISWLAIKNIKQYYLHGKEIHHYQQQILTKTFSKINQEKQNKILYIKQKINQSKGEYLNPFLPNSWTFSLQKIIEESEAKLIKEKNNAYLYPIIKDGDRYEYFHSYILNLYQQEIIEILKSQWSKINSVYDDGGLNIFVAQANQKIETIGIFEYSEIEPPKIELDLEPFPEFSLSKIVDPHCLKANSKLIFDYNYTQSTWFKLLMSASIGTTIYLVTKLYFGSGKYIGFFILFVQIINIFTGQSVKKAKLKAHKKELKRILNNKYQILIRLVAEQITQTLIVSLDKKNREYQNEIDEIAQLGQDRLNQIKQDIEQHQLRKNMLNNDKEKIKAWFD